MSSPASKPQSNEVTRNSRHQATPVSGTTSNSWTVRGTVSTSPLKRHLARSAHAACFSRRTAWAKPCAGGAHRQKSRRTIQVLGRRSAYRLQEPGRGERPAQRAGWPIENFRDMHREDLLGICIPKEEGGVGADLATYCLAAAELGRYCGATARSPGTRPRPDTLRSRTPPCPQRRLRLRRTAGHAPLPYRLMQLIDRGLFQTKEIATAGACITGAFWIKALGMIRPADRAAEFLGCIVYARLRHQNAHARAIFSRARRKAQRIARRS